MKVLLRILLIPLLLQLFLSGCAAVAANGDEEAWAPTPPRVSFIDGEVSYFRQGAEEWAAARVNLPLAEGDALYTGRESNFEVQFGSRSFVRADEESRLTLVRLEEGYTQFEVPSGRVSFDVRRLPAGSRLEVNTPYAVFLIQDPGYYRVEVEGRDTHFITRHGGEATVTTADGRSLSIFPSEDIVVSGGTPVKVATYAAPPADDWDRWNDARSDRIGASVSARYLPPNVYGADELDHYGYWRVVPTYGAVWIPNRVSVTWVPYSTGYWIWDPYYEWTWVDDAPWGWAPFHYGRWVYIDGYWAWAPGPVVPRAVYAPAQVGFMVVGSSVSVSVSVGMPGVWWVPLGWGEPLVPWWHRHRYHGHPRWDGWGGPHLINGHDYRDRRALPKVTEIRYHNAALPRALLTVPPDKFGRERIHATVDTRHSRNDFVALRDEVPIKPSRASLYGGAPRGLQPPREVTSRPVVSTRPQPQPAPRPWQEQGPRTPQAQQAPRTMQREAPEPRFVVPPKLPRATDKRPLPRPPFGTEGGPEVTPQPLPPSYGDIKRSISPRQIQREQQEQMERREQTSRPQQPQRRETREEQREQMERREQTSRPQQPQRRETREEQREQMERRERASRPQQPQRREMREEQREQRRPLPGRPANQPHKKFERD